MRVNPDCDRVAVEWARGRTSADANWLDVVQTLTTGLRVSPCLEAAGFQEMRPALALDVASKGDAFTGIKRADTASVENYSIFGNSLHDRKRYSGTARNAGLVAETLARLRKFPRNQQRVLTRSSPVGRPEWVELLVQGASALLTDSHCNGWDRRLVGLSGRGASSA